MDNGVSMVVIVVIQIKEFSIMGNSDRSYIVLRLISMIIHLPSYMNEAYKIIENRPSLSSTS